MSPHDHVWITLKRATSPKHPARKGSMFAAPRPPEPKVEITEGQVEYYYNKQYEIIDEDLDFQNCSDVLARLEKVPKLRTEKECSAALPPDASFQRVGVLLNQHCTAQRVT